MMKRYILYSINLGPPASKTYKINEVFNKEAPLEIMLLIICEYLSYRLMNIYWATKETPGLYSSILFKTLI